MRFSTFSSKSLLEFLVRVQQAIPFGDQQFLGDDLPQDGGIEFVLAPLAFIRGQAAVPVQLGERGTGTVQNVPERDDLFVHDRDDGIADHERLVRGEAEAGPQDGREPCDHDERLSFHGFLPARPGAGTDSPRSSARVSQDINCAPEMRVR